MSLVSEFFHLLEKNGFEVTAPKKKKTLSLEEVKQVLNKLESGEKLDAEVPNRAKNVRLVRQGKAEFFLYVKERDGEKGFWGVTERQIRQLDDQPAASRRPWALILLHQSPTCGIWFDAAQVRELAGSVWRLPEGQYDYKINAPHGIANGSSFSTESSLLTLLKDFRASC
jgi:hypothetical protein